MCNVHIYTGFIREYGHAKSKPMTTVPVPANDPLSTALSDEQSTLLDALDGLLAPLADLCLAKGVTIQLIEERLRHSFVQSAIYAHGGLPPGRLASRISASTGLTRREVARLQGEDSDKPLARREPKRSPATELFTRWMCDAELRGDNGLPRALPRLGLAPSFERLAQSVTQDIHPRSLLDELCRLGLAVWDTDTDEVQLVQEAFVPRGDWARMTSFLADNVGDHLRAAAANVLTDGNAHLEQAIFADELSVESLERFREIMAAHWRGMLDQLPAQLEQLIEEDAAAGRRQNQRVRVGLYTWSQPMAAATRHLNLVANNVALPRARASAPAHTLTPKTHPESEP
jgi:hypothetical protein